MKSNKNIKCDVETCKFNNCNDNYCTLKQIEVSCNASKDKINNKDETICNSYKSEV